MALSQTAIRRWYLVHKWTSVVVTAFLLLLCVWPALIGIATIVGLVSALVGDGWYDVVSWCSLGFTVLVMVRAYGRPAPV